MLDNVGLNDLLGLTTLIIRQAAERNAMQYQDILQSWACRFVDPKTVRHDKPLDNHEVREEMKAIASKLRRFSYSWIAAWLKNASYQINDERLCRFEKLKVPVKQPKKRRLWINNVSCVSDDRQTL